jgi:hypothetical protein
MLKKIATIVLLISSAAIAEQRVALNPGMSPSDVLKSWGAPDELVEKETRREVVWIYGDRRVSFRDGKLLADDQQVVALKDKAASKPQPLGFNSYGSVTGTNGESTHDRAAMDEVFNEVLRSIPSEPDGARSGGRASSAVPPSVGRIIPGRPGGEMDEEME